MDLSLGPSVNWALVVDSVSRDFLNGRNLNFLNETKEVNDLPSLDRLSFASGVLSPLLCVHAHLWQQRSSNVKPMAQLSAC